ncbi:MAG: hypothetical protein ACOX41_03020 [Anaerovoracaceae bacterium]
MTNGGNPAGGASRSLSAAGGRLGWQARRLRKKIERLTAALREAEKLVPSGLHFDEETRQQKRARRKAGRLAEKLAAAKQKATRLEWKAVRRDQKKAQSTAAARAAREEQEQKKRRKKEEKTAKKLEAEERRQEQKRRKEQEKTLSKLERTQAKRDKDQAAQEEKARRKDARSGGLRLSDGGASKEKGAAAAKAEQRPVIRDSDPNAPLKKIAAAQEDLRELMIQADAAGRQAQKQWNSNADPKAVSQAEAEIAAAKQQLAAAKFRLDNVEEVETARREEEKKINRQIIIILAVLFGGLAGILLLWFLARDVLITIAAIILMPFVLHLAKIQDKPGRRR